MAIPQIIYSSIISSVINALIRIISLSEKEIIKIKKDENYKKMLKDIPKIKKCLKIRFASFFIVCFIFLVFFWYYLSSFGAIYKNTQLYLLKDTLISFGISMIYPFFIYLITAFLRFIALKHPDYIYKLSNILQMC